MRRAAAFRHGEFGVDLSEVLADHEVDADAGHVGLFTRFGEEDHVAIELHAEALQHQHGHQVRGQHRLVILAAPSPDVAVLHDRAERVDGPLLALHADDIGVGENQQGPPRPVALEPRDEVGAGGIECECLVGMPSASSTFLSSRRPGFRGRPSYRAGPGRGSARRISGRSFSQSTARAPREFVAPSEQKSAHGGREGHHAFHADDVADAAAPRPGFPRSTLAFSRPRTSRVLTQLRRRRPSLSRARLRAPASCTAAAALEFIASQRN